MEVEHPQDVLLAGAGVLGVLAQRAVQQNRGQTNGPQASSNLLRHQGRPADRCPLPGTMARESYAN